MIKLENILNTFAERLKEFLEEKGWSIQEFSTKIDIPRTTINSWLLRLKSPRVDSLYQIADFFGVTIDYLVGRED